MFYELQPPKKKKSDITFFKYLSNLLPEAYAVNQLYPEIKTGIS